MSGHLSESLAVNTPWLLATSFLAVQTEPTQTKFLLSLVRLALQFHLFLIFVE